MSKEKLQQCTTFRVFLLRSYAQHASCHVVSFENELISMMCYFTFLVERVRDGLHFLYVLVLCDDIQNAFRGKVSAM